MTERQPRIPRRSPKSKWPATICHQVTCLLSHSTGAMLQVADNPHESSSAGPGTCLSTLRNITAQLLGQSWVQDLGTSRASRVKTSQFAIQTVWQSPFPVGTLRELNLTWCLCDLWKSAQWDALATGRAMGALSIHKPKAVPWEPQNLNSWSLETWGFLFEIVWTGFVNRIRKLLA